LLALLVSGGAVLVLVLVLALGPNGPARLWLDGDGSTVSLKARNADPSGATLPGSPVGLLAGNPDGSIGVVLASPGTTVERSGAVRLRAIIRRRQRTAARTPAARRPGAPSPARTPSPQEPVSRSPGTAPAPATTPAPTPRPVEKTRGRGTPAPENDVPKQRVSSNEAAPAPTAEPTTGPAPELRSVTSTPTPTGGDASDGMLHRVPPS
jgi:hypothetical protein